MKSSISACSQDKNICERGKKLGERGHYTKTWDELPYFNIWYHPSAKYTYDLNSTMTVPVKPYRVKGGTNDVSLDIY